MYQPAHGKFVGSSTNVLHKLIRDYPLGTFITSHGSEVAIDHVPFLLDASGKKLFAHVPRANPVWQGLDGNPVQIVFHGPNAYISPSWYATKREHGKVVPTWNYAIVHASGTARAIADRAWLLAHIDELTDTHEKSLSHPWRVSDAPIEYIDKMLGAIVGVEVLITKLEGKFKLSQNRPAPDRRGVVDGLSAAGSPLSAWVSKFGVSI